jgi:hypothetical protein
MMSVPRKRRDAALPVVRPISAESVVFAMVGSWLVSELMKWATRSDEEQPVLECMGAQ